ncbi:MAG: cysteine--tRNA ligase [Candidatus Heimdallarchaeota archaeon]|nr:MAG: cysteine--tRNA ligase [Candidatus Heimdallarchaeota archaeon]
MRLYNSLTRKKEEFIPIENKKVRFYSCGQTVYEDAHIGNARTYSYWDVLVRYLRWRNYDVFWVQNFTDVGHLTDDADSGEDKIILTARAKEIQPMVLVESQIRRFYEDMDALNIQRSDIYPRATGEIPEMIEFVKDLLEKGYAYEVNGSIYYDVTKFPNYGELSPSTYSDESVGARIAVNPEKRNPQDFALWIRAPPEHLMKWPSPWGFGYPGWHLECSVMSQKYLGATLDIHGGGIDHLYLHHPNEIAQSEARTGEKFVNYWLHAAFLTVEGERMGKSKGNFILVRELLQEYDPMLVRLFLVNSHYRKGVDFNREALDQIQILLDRLRTSIATIDQASGGNKSNLRDDILQVEKDFIEAMEDDLNTVGAIQSIMQFIKKVNTSLDNEKALLEEAKSIIITLTGILGIKLEEQEQRGKISIPELLDLLVDLRGRLREAKQFELSDQVRAKLLDIGVQLEDKPDGTIWKIKS